MSSFSMCMDGIVLLFSWHIYMVRGELTDYGLRFHCLFFLSLFYHYTFSISSLQFLLSVALCLHSSPTLSEFLLLQYAITISVFLASTFVVTAVFHLLFLSYNWPVSTYSSHNPFVVLPTVCLCCSDHITKAHYLVDFA